MKRSMPFLVATSLLGACSGDDPGASPIGQGGETGHSDPVFPDDPEFETDSDESSTGYDPASSSDGPIDETSASGEDTDGTTGDDGSTSDDGTSTTDDGTTSGDDTTPGDDTTTTGEVPDDTHQLYQGSWNGGIGYEFGLNSIDTLDITGAPEDTDWSRWAMLHDGSRYRLYFMREGSDDTMYQFAYNPDTLDYEFGFDSIPQLDIVGAPADADMSSFAMLHSGEYYHLYAQSETDPLRVYQFLFDPVSQDYVYALAPAIPQIPVDGFAAGTDFSGWAMLWENDAYRFYAFADETHDAMAQGAYNPAAGAYQWGFDSIPFFDIIGFPDDTNTDDFAMLHDGDAFRFYMLRE